MLPSAAVVVVSGIVVFSGVVGCGVSVVVVFRVVVLSVVAVGVAVVVPSGVLDVVEVEFTETTEVVVVSVV